MYVTCTFKWRWLFAAFVIFAAYTGDADADDKPWRDENISKEIQSICDKAESLRLPPQDTPSGAETAKLKGCSSRNLFYGISKASDYVAARKCAFMERSAAGDDLALGGSSVLMMIYANGYGVSKNFDIAIKLACEMGGAPAEIEGRIQHLNELKTKRAGTPLKDCSTENGPPPDYGRTAGFCDGNVDICDDVTSGSMQGVCASIASDLENAKADASLRAITSKWPPDHQKAFEDLAKTANAYFEAHSNNEIDLSGSARGAMFIDEKDSMRKDFRQAIESFENRKMPVYTQQDFNRADKALNATYVTAMKKFTKDQSAGVTKEGIRKTEKLWLTFRGSWVNFAELHYSNLTPESLETRLTLDRIEIIKNIPNGRNLEDH
jgi:uncharacterized protein YecT (DUF1311 family)